MAPAAATVISDEEIANIEKAIKDAVGKEGEAVNVDVTITRGFMQNKHKVEGRKLKLYDQHAWFGEETNPPYFQDIPWSDTLPGNKWFAHEGPLPGGCKACLVYTDGTETTDRKWIVAFDSLNRKVYVEAGPIGPTDWAAVEDKLGKASAYEDYEDPVYHGKAHAQMARNSVGCTLIVVFSN